MAADPLALGSLCALGDDCLRKALTFLTPPGMRTRAGSHLKSNARGSVVDESSVLYG